MPTLGSSALGAALTPCFPVTAQPAPHPRGHTPISQDGSIAPVYILLCPVGYLFLRTTMKILDIKFKLVIYGKRRTIHK